MRAVRAVPSGHRSPSGAAAARGRQSAPGRGRPGDAGRVDLRARPDRIQCGALGVAGVQTVTEVRVDGRPVEVPAGATILRACEQAGIDTPTLCWARNLTPQNA